MPILSETEIDAARAAAILRIQNVAEAMRVVIMTGLEGFLHTEFSNGQINAEDLHEMQTEISGVTDHISLLINWCKQRNALELDNSDPEPHGSRDTFVPHPDGPAPEHFNPLQD